MSIITIEVNGTRFEGWTKISVKRSIENLCGTFSFISTFLPVNKFPVKIGQNCNIHVDDVLFLTGWVEKIRIDYSVDVHTIVISGRDITNDVVDSQIDHVDFNPPITLKSMTEKVLSDLNLKTIKVIDRFNLPPFENVETDSLGTTAFAFLETYAKKSQVLLTTDGKGNIVFERAGKEQFNTVLSTKDGTVATILSADISFDDTKRFNEYKVVGQDNVGAAAWFDRKSTPEQSSSVEGEAFDKEIRTSRKYVFQPKDNGTTLTNTQRALWELNYRVSHSFIYTAIIQGFIPFRDEGIWEVNKLVQVVDDRHDVNRTLLITGLEFSLSNEGGAITKLTLMQKEAFTTFVKRPEKEKKDQKTGGLWFDREPQKS